MSYVHKLTFVWRKKKKKKLIKEGLIIISM